MIWWPTEVPTLQYGAITLRPPQESDIPKIHQGCLDPLIPKFTRIPAEYTLAHAELLVRENTPNSLAAKSGILFIIENRATPEEKNRATDEGGNRAITEGDGEPQFCGAISFHSIDLSDHVAELGYWIVASARGKGIGTTGVRVITDYGFTTLGFRRIEAVVDVENLASRKLLDHAGYLLEGVMRNKSTRSDGSQKDMALYAQTQRDWKGI